MCSKSLFSTFMWGYYKCISKLKNLTPPLRSLANPAVLEGQHGSPPPPPNTHTASLPHLYCKASLSAVALDSYFPTSMLIRSALLLHSSRVMVRRSFWDLRCSMRLQRKKNLFHDFTLGLQFICQYLNCLLWIQATHAC